MAYKIYRLKDSNFGFLAIVLKENQTLIGLCALQNYLAFYIVIEYAFKELRIKRIAYAVDSENVKSINLMKRLGFRLGKNLHPDWPGITGILENNLI